jgi:hypothetical protein
MRHLPTIGIFMDMYRSKLTEAALEAVDPPAVDSALRLVAHAGYMRLERSKFAPIVGHVFQLCSACGTVMDNRHNYKSKKSRSADNQHQKIR